VQPLQAWAEGWGLGGIRHGVVQRVMKSSLKSSNVDHPAVRVEYKPKGKTT